MGDDGAKIARRRQEFAKLESALHLTDGESWLRGSLELALMNGDRKLLCTLLEKIYLQFDDVGNPLLKWNRHKPAVDALRRGALSEFCRQLATCEDTMRNLIRRKLRAHPEFANFAEDARGFRQVFAVCRLIGQAEMEAKQRFREVLRACKNESAGATIHNGPKPRKHGVMN